MAILFLPSSVFAEEKVTIRMQEGSFNPNKLEIRKGQIVVFENIGQDYHWPASDIHPTHSIYPEFDPKKPISPGESWEFKFDKVGSWRFHDHLNPQVTGTLVVKNTNDQVQTAKTPKFNLLDNFSVWWNGLTRNISHFLASKTQVSPKPYQIDSLYGKLKLQCSSSDFNCISNLLKTVTSTYGPGAATDVLDRLEKDHKVNQSTIDDHQLAHQIGRQTATIFGINSEAFLLCSMSAYNGGCQHGFFEVALAHAASTKDAAESICESLGQTYSSKDKFYCYHGVGHGVMMAQAYDLDKSLKTCDSLSNPSGEDGCWQGVFMENVNAGMNDKARDGIFSKDDPLAPCDKEEEKYKHECYINHSGYLMKFFNNNFDQAAQACLPAGANAATCVNSLGLLTTNPSWQSVITGASEGKDQVDIALKICSGAPENFKKNCFIGGLDNIMNNDQMELDLRALKYCQKGDWDKKECYKQMGVNIARQVVDLSERKKLCKKVEQGFYDSCAMSAGI